MNIFLFLDENDICVKVFEKKLGRARQVSDRPAPCISL